MAQTDQHNSIRSVQSERRQEENADSQLWQWGKKILQKKFYSMWSPSPSLSLAHAFTFFIIICSFTLKSLQLCKSPPLLIQKKLSSKRGACASSPPTLLTAPTLKQVHLHKHPNAEQGRSLLWSLGPSWQHQPPPCSCPAERERGHCPSHLSWRLCLTAYRNQLGKECLSGKSIPAFVAVKTWEWPQTTRKGTRSHIQPALVTPEPVSII